MKIIQFSSIALSLAVSTSSALFAEHEAPGLIQMVKSKQIVPKASVQTKCGSKRSVSTHHIKRAQPELRPILKPNHGAKLDFGYTDLPNHEAVKITFLLHIVGPWDGTRYPKWGPDRMLVTVDDGMRLLDATFNNCHLLFIDNVWQTFPDPYHRRQGVGLNYRRMLQYGGEGSERIASLGFQSNKNRSVDSTYRFNFTVRHDSKDLNLSYEVNWVEDASLSTYWVENLQVKPISKVSEIKESAEERAWQTMLSGDAKAAQKVWSTVYTAHPDLYLKRIQSLVKSTPDRRKWIIKKLGEGEVPVESLIRDVTLSPRQRDVAGVIKRIALLRELSLELNPYSNETGAFLSKREYTPLTHAIRKACYSNKGMVVRRIKMRLAAYLRMIHTPEALELLKLFDRPANGSRWGADSEDDPKER